MIVDGSWHIRTREKTLEYLLNRRGPVPSADSPESGLLEQDPMHGHTQRGFQGSTPLKIKKEKFVRFSVSQTVA